MMMPGRNGGLVRNTTTGAWEWKEEGNDYRYGFNDKENDAETGTQDYGMRIYDPRLGKFLSVDPITAHYPMLTPYQFASNSPIAGIDLDGLEFYKAGDAYVNIFLIYNPKLKRITDGTVNIRMSNVPPVMVAIIENANTCPTCIGSSAAEIAKFKVAFQTSLIKAPDQADLKDIDDPNAVGPDPVTLPIISQNGKQERTQRRTREFTTPVLEGNNTKGGTIVAAVELLGNMGTWMGEQHLKSIANKAEVQALTIANVTGIIQSGIDKGLIGEVYLNSASLTGLANYLLYGAEITKTELKNGKYQTITDKKLMEIGKNLWKEYKKKQKQILLLRKMEEEKKPKVDNTGKGNSGGFTP